MSNDKCKCDDCQCAACVEAEKILKEKKRVRKG